MDNNPTMFKTAVGGFDKKAVISYIFELNESAQAEQKKLKEQLEEAKQSRQTQHAELEAQNDRVLKLEAELKAVKNELSGEKSRVFELTDTVESLNSEIEQQRLLIDKKEQLVRESTEQTGELKDRVDVLASREADIERASAQVGKLLLDAASDADRIRDEAKKEAEDIINTAHKDAEKIILDSETALQSVKSEFESYSGELQSLQDEMLRAIEALQQKAGSIGDIISDASSRLVEKPVSEDIFTPGIFSDVEEVEEESDLDEPESYSFQSWDNEESTESDFFRPAAEE